MNPPHACSRPLPFSPPKIDRWLFATARIFFVLLAIWAEPGVLGAETTRTGVAIGLNSGNGRILLGELGCTACHKPGTLAAGLLVRQAPRLGEVGLCITPEYLRAFLADPGKVKPGTPMPDLLHGLSADKRKAVVEDFVHFLAAQGGPIEPFRSAPAAKQVERGKALYHSVGCVACHPAFEPPPQHKVDPIALPDKGAKKAPSRDVIIPLGNLTRKTTPTALARFLSNPLHVRPSGRMPSLELTAKESAAIAGYLMSGPTGKGAAKADSFAIDPVRSKRGRDHFARLGCASCHDTGIHEEPKPLDLRARGVKVVAIAPANNRSPGSEGPRQAIDNNPRTKYLNFGKAGSGLLITLPGPVVVGALELTSANDAPDRDPSSYLLEGSSDGRSFGKIDSRTVPPFPDRYKTQSFRFDNDEAYSVYRVTFPTLRKNATDAMQIADVRLFAAPKPSPGIASTLTARALGKLTPTAAGGCLDAKVKAGRPRFALSTEQRTALRSALAELQEPASLTPAVQIDQTMTAFNCYACHSRGGKGGPDSARSGYFGYEVVVDLGDEGRLPPDLSGIGAKLTAAGFDEALYGGERYRTYMATRMPRFGQGNLKDLPGLFAKADAGKALAHKPTFVQSMVDDGRRLTGKNALACVSCHAWGGRRVAGAEGLDLHRAYKRLQPGWFHALLLDPQRIRPRTRMPSSWPDGNTFSPRIQGGDVHKQIDAVWAYLGQGRTAGAPDGITMEKGPLLIPGDEPIVFRTFLDGFGAHAILVGFRQRTHVAFDANRVRMVVAWAGDFISPAAAWEGRGGMYAKIPGSDLVRFPDGPPLAVLESATAKWPPDVPKARMGTKRTPPGWRYLGYRYDDKRVPTFIYKAGSVRVEETPTSEPRTGSGCLIRRFQLTADEDVKGLYLRVAAGKKTVENKGAYSIDGRLTYRIETTPSSTALIRESGGQQELLVPVRFEAAAKGRQARIVVELTW